MLTIFSDSFSEIASLISTFGIGTVAKAMGGKAVSVAARFQFKETLNLYQEMLEQGVAKECARFILPLATPTRIYMTGSCRSWIHYINLRSGHGTQKEHLIIANQCREIFSKQFPTVSIALNWNEN